MTPYGKITDEQLVVRVYENLQQVFGTQDSPAEAVVLWHPESAPPSSGEISRLIERLEMKPAVDAVLLDDPEAPISNIVNYLTLLWLPEQSTGLARLERVTPLIEKRVPEEPIEMAFWIDFLTHLDVGRVSREGEEPSFSSTPLDIATLGPRINYLLSLSREGRVFSEVPQSIVVDLTLHILSHTCHQLAAAGGEALNWEILKALKGTLIGLSKSIESERELSVERPEYFYALKRKFGVLFKKPDSLWQEVPSPPAPYLFERFGSFYDHRGQSAEAIRLYEISARRGCIYSRTWQLQAALKDEGSTNALLKEKQEAWVKQAIENPSKVTLPERSFKDHREVRIGYFAHNWSVDYTKYQVASFVAQHSLHVKCYCYSNETIPGEVACYFDEIRSPLKDLSDERFAETIRQDKIDILVDIWGFSSGNRFAAFARRGAPIQVSYANHTGTTAVPNIDYTLSDEISSPVDADAHFTETIHRLPGSFFCFSYNPDDLPEIVDPPILKRGYPTFGCFGSGSKFSRGMLELWGSLLKAMPNAKLNLCNMQLAQPQTRDLVLDRLIHYGAKARQIIIFQGAPREQILKMYGNTDISLDTWPYCGGNTLAESFWQGVPAISLKGDRFSSAYGASILKASGLEDLIAHSPEEFITNCQVLADDPDRLLELRYNLRDMVMEHGFSDPRRFAKKLEQAYDQMLEEKGIPKRIDGGIIVDGVF